MARHPLFIDDALVAHALDAATAAALQPLAEILPELGSADGNAFRQRLRDHLAAMLAGRPGAAAAGPQLQPLVHGDDVFGDRFSVADLPLPRPGSGYAVQMLDTDRLLDRRRGEFLAVRDAELDGLFDSFECAHAAARRWLAQRRATVDQCPLAIVPACYDRTMQRHVLIYGVLTDRP